MEHTLAPWTGNMFALPAPQAVAMPSTSHVRRWSLRVGRDGITLTSTSESFSPDGAAPLTRVRAQGPRPIVAMATGALALLLIGATAGRAWSPEPTPREAPIVVPAARPFVLAPPTAPATRGQMAPKVRATEPVAAVPVAPTADEKADFGAAPPLLNRKDAVTRALTTGEFQEWAERDGVTGFAVAGPVEPGSTGDCRALAVLARKPDGSDAVSSSRVCQPVNAAAAPE